MGEPVLKLVDSSRKVTIYCPPEHECLQYAKWMGQFVDDFDPVNCTPVVVFYEDEIVGMVTFSRPHFNRVEMALASSTPKWVTRSNLLTLMSPAFAQYGYAGITATVKRANKRVRKLLEGMGWKREGCLRKADANGGNILIYGLLRSEYLDLVKKWKPQVYDEWKKIIEGKSHGS